MAFLPINKNEMLAKGWNEVDFVLISGDAYVDHPSFGVAIISRVLEAHNFKVGIIAQPNWKSDDDFMVFDKPRLGFLVTSGNIDSMVNHYTVNKKRRKEDKYSDEAKADKRPDRAVIVYTQIIKRLFPDIPVIIGGIEASLRRLAHYDYWDDKVRNSIMIDSQADLLVYGMAERVIVEIAEALDSGLEIEHLTYIRGTAYKTKTLDTDAVLLPDINAIKEDKKKYCESFKMQHDNRDALNAKRLIESYPGWYIVVNQPALPLSQQEMDDTYDRDYEYRPHPMYKHVPAFDEVQFSIISNRGCFGSCSFCALTAHQGRIISSRSANSIINEAKKMIQQPDFKGYIHDVGGPTANFYTPSCDKQLTHGTCVDKECLYPEPCNILKVDHSEYLAILRSLISLPNLKKVFVRSGLRYDYLIYDKNEAFFDELVQHHISGQLKVAPEHISPNVLRYMHKPSRKVYDLFVAMYEEKNQKFKKDQYLIPYLISSHPGSTLDDAIALALYLKKQRYLPEQVQDFYPTPATAATCMYYTEIDPFTMKKVYVAKDLQEKQLQRALLHFNNPHNHELVIKALQQAKREDLIGNDEHCLVKAKPYFKKESNKIKAKRRSS